MTFRKPWVSPLFPFSWRDLALTAGILSLAAALCFFLQKIGRASCRERVWSRV